MRRYTCGYTFLRTCVRAYIHSRVYAHVHPNGRTHAPPVAPLCARSSAHNIATAIHTTPVHLPPSPAVHDLCIRLHVRASADACVCKQSAEHGVRSIDTQMASDRRGPIIGPTRMASDWHGPIIGPTQMASDRRGPIVAPDGRPAVQVLAQYEDVAVVDAAVYTHAYAHVYTHVYLHAYLHACRPTC